MRKPRFATRRNPLARFEALEGRRMLATDLAQIAGTLPADLNGDGTNDLVSVATRTLQLFRDNGDGVFGGADTSQGTTVTNASGAYAFDNLIAGTYFVRVNSAAGTPSNVVAPVSAAIRFTPTEAMGATNIRIDEFDAAQTLPAATLGAPTSSTVDDSGIAGGEQDLSAEVTAGAGSITAVSGFNNLFDNVLSLSSGSGVNGRLVATWDGNDNAGATLAQGLGLDVSQSGANRAFVVNMSVDTTARGDLILRAYSGAGNSSAVTVPLTNIDGGADNGTADDVDTDGIINGVGPEEISIDFSRFVTATGTGVDFANVTAFQLELDFTGAGENGLDAEIEVLGVMGFTTRAADFSALQYDLTITKVVDQPTAAPGDTLRYTAVVTNNGPVAATGVTLTDTLPTPVRFVSGTTTVFGQTVVGSGSSDTVTSTIGTLAAGATATITINATIDSAATGTLTNNVATAGVDESNTTNNSASAVTTVAPEIDLTITKIDNDNGATLAPGDTVVYTLTPRNNGPSAATGVTVTDTLPTGLTFVSAGSTTPTTNTVVGGGRQLTYSVGSLASGASGAPITIVATIDAGVSGTLTNTSSVAGNESETNAANNTALASSTVAIPAPVLGAITGKVFVDFNENNVQDSEDRGIQGFTIRLFNSAGLQVGTTTTDASGCYQFTGLAPDTYRVVQDQIALFPDLDETSGTTGAIVNAVDNQISSVVVNGNTAPANNFTEGPPTIGKRSFFFSSGLFT